MARPALIPIREGQRLSLSADSSESGGGGGCRGRRRRRDPFVPLFPSFGVSDSRGGPSGAAEAEEAKDDGGAAAIVLGRAEFLRSYLAACSCAAASGWKEERSGSACGRPKQLCRRCCTVQDWARRYLSRRMVRLSPVPPPSPPGSFRAEVRGENAADLVWADGRRVATAVIDCASVASGEEEATARASGDGDGKEWRSGAVLNIGSVLSLGFREDAEASLRFRLEDLDVRGRGWDRVRIAVAASAGPTEEPSAEGERPDNDEEFRKSQSVPPSLVEGNRRPSVAAGTLIAAVMDVANGCVLDEFGQEGTNVAEIGPKAANSFEPEGEREEAKNLKTTTGAENKDALKALSLPRQDDNSDVAGHDHNPPLGVVRDPGDTDDLVQSAEKVVNSNTSAGVEGRTGTSKAGGLACWFGGHRVGTDDRTDDGLPVDVDAAVVSAPAHATFGDGSSLSPLPRPRPAAGNGGGGSSGKDRAGVVGRGGNDGDHAKLFASGIGTRGGDGRGSGAGISFARGSIADGGDGANINEPPPGGLAAGAASIGMPPLSPTTNGPESAAAAAADLDLPVAEAASECKGFCIDCRELRAEGGVAPLANRCFGDHGGNSPIGKDTLSAPEADALYHDPAKGDLDMYSVDRAAPDAEGAAARTVASPNPPPAANPTIVDLCSSPFSERNEGGSAAAANAGGEISDVEIIEVADDIGDDNDDDRHPRSPSSLSRAGTQKAGNLSFPNPSIATGGMTRGGDNDRDGGARRPAILLLPLGQSMSSSRVRILRSMLERKGVCVVDSLRGKEREGEGLTRMAMTPTHVVLDGAVSVARAASALGLRDAKEMLGIFAECKIKAVKPDWVVQSRTFLDEPTLEQCWTGLRGAKKNTSKKRLRSSALGGKSQPSTEWIKRSRREDEFPKESLVKASLLRDDDCCMVSRVLKRQEEHDSSTSKGSKPRRHSFGSEDSSIGTNEATRTKNSPVRAPRCLHNVFRMVRNKEPADMFDELSKLHKSCPLVANDEWRTYHYAIISGRLRNLDFDVVDRADVLRRLKQIKGFGDSAMTKVREFLRTGTCRKLIELQKDPMRAGVCKLMKIHGVGPRKAAELVKMGYTTIEKVRNGLATGALQLSAISLIGVECYEDLQEKMDRKEVEMIGKIIIDACEERFPGVTVDIMGSYRRGKGKLGDVDILMTHNDYVDTIPRGAVGELVNRLRKRGHIAFDLNRVEGMSDSCGGFNSETSESSTPVVRQSMELPSLRSRNENPNSSSYMGVFFSPIFPGKRRRVDIKFYPHRERPFATLYFTGSGFFNRSMRLWARRKKQMSLNDHGIFPIDMAGGATKATGTRMEYRGKGIEAKTEKDVFDLLNLEYRSPPERDCFDAVVEIGAQKPIELNGDFAKDSAVRDTEASHVWVD